MKKVLLGAAISAALFGGAAQATITFTSGNLPTAATLADTTVLYLSGSSAMAELIERGVSDSTKESVCKAGTVHKFTEANKNQDAYLCELNTVANGSGIPNTAIPPGITTSNLLIYKRNEGGSNLGVAPIVTPAPVAFLNITNGANSVGTASCTTATSTVFASLKTCAYNNTTNTTLATPDFGLADVNPQIFTTASENSPLGTVPATPPGPTTTTYQIVPAPALAFGVAVTTKLRNALQEAQFGLGDACVDSNTEACMPSLNKGTIATLFAAYPSPISPLKAGISAPAQGAGKVNDWKQLKVGATDLFTLASAANKPGSSRVHLCSRVVGSGTKAQFNVKFLNNPCSNAGSKIVQHADHSAIGETFSTGQKQSTYVAGPIANPESATSLLKLRPLVHAMSTGGGMDECLDELDLGSANTAGSFTPGTNYGAAGSAAVRWAIGYTSLDKNATLSKSYRFIKIDGVAPTLQNVANGTYSDWIEGTFQYNVNHLPAGSKRSLVLEVISSFTTPTVLSFVNTKVATFAFGTSGFLAVPNKVHPAPATGIVNLAAPVNPLSHAIYPGTATQATNNCRVPLIYTNDAPVNNAQGLQIVH